MKSIFRLAFLFAVTVFIGACSSTSGDTQSSRDALPTLPKISVQLWSVKNEVKNDIDGTLQQLADLGFDGVEFANEFGRYSGDAAALRRKMDALGLKGSGAHVSFEQLNDENLMDTVALYKELGVSTLIVPYDVRAWSPAQDGIHFVVSELNALSKKLAPHGMQVGFHNHDQEFNDYQGTTYWDYMAKNTAPEVVMQQDVGWTTYAGRDPVDYVKRYPGRTLTTHYKVKLPKGAEDKLPIIGQDTIDWKSLLKANMTVGGTEWIVVEQEEYPNGMTPLEAVAASMSGLKNYLN